MCGSESQKEGDFMGFRFRKSLKAGPIRVNFSKSGIGFSAGVKGARITKPAKGKARTTVGIPGTGLSYSKTVGGKKKSATKKSTSNKSASKKTYPKKQQPSTTSELTVEDYEKGIGCLVAAARWAFILFMAFLAYLIGFKFRTVFPVAAILMALPIGVWQDLLTDKLHMSILSKLSAGAAFTIAGMFYTKPPLVAFAGMLLVLAVLLSVIAKPKTEAEAAAEDVADPEDPTIIAEVTAEPEDEQEATPCIHHSAQELDETDQPIIDPLIAQFENELLSIPKIEISTSDPVSKQFLKDMPEYYFSNITRTTRMDTLFPLVFLDVETTGLYPSKSEIVEVSAIKFESGMVPVSCFTTLCKPSKPIPEEASAINKITDDMVQDAPSFREIAPALTEYIQDCNIAGHNLEFDLRFIFVHGVQIPWTKRFYDTLDLAHYTIPESRIWNYKLDTLCDHYRIRRDKAHRSLSDCYATSKLFAHLVFDKTSRQLDSSEVIVPN